MNIPREHYEQELRSGGMTQRVKYLGFFPVKVPVHEMTGDMRSMLLKHSIDSLESMAKNISPPPPNHLLSLVLGEAKLGNSEVDLVISSQQIVLRKDDGQCVCRVPMKFTSVIERLQHSDCIGFIAKRLDESQRRCTVIKADKSEAAERIMEIMSHAMSICNDEQAALEEEASTPSPSGSATPLATTPLVPPPPFPHPQDPLPNLSIPPFATGPATTPRRQPPLSTSKIRMGPKATELAQFRWYHGYVPRQEAGARLRRPGEFLIRESDNQKDGQVILSGRNDQNEEKHLLLFDSEGRVKTQLMEFSNVADLVKYYMESGSTIVMANENQLQLKYPVDRPH